MATEPVKKESGTAGKPGETTATPRRAEAPAEMDLTSEGVSSALAREFAEEQTPPAAGQEVQPVTEGESTVEREEEVEPGAGTEEEVQTEETPAGETAEGEVVEEQEEQPAGELPAELQGALDAWQEQGGELPPVLQKMVERRIGKLTAKAKAAEEQVAQLTTELEAARKGPGADAGNPYVAESEMETAVRRFAEDAEAVRAGNATERQAESIRKFLLKNDLDESTLPAIVNQAKHEVAKFDVRREDVLRTWKEKESAAEPIAKKHFPWLFDTKAPEYAMSRRVLAEIPTLSKLTPQHQIALGIYVVGLKAFEKMLAPAGATAAPKVKPGAKVVVTKAPSKVPIAGAAAPSGARTRNRAAAEEAVRAKFKSHPTRESATELARIALQG